MIALSRSLPVFFSLYPLSLLHLLFIFSQKCILSLPSPHPCDTLPQQSAVAYQHCTHTNTITHSRSFSLSLAHTHTCSRSLSLSQTYSLTLSTFLSLSLSLSLS